LVPEDPVVMRDASPLVFDCASEVSERVSLQNRQRDEDVRVQHDLRKVDRSNRIDVGLSPLRLRHVYEADAKTLCQLGVTGNIEGLPSRLAKSARLNDGDVRSFLKQNLADRLSDTRICVRHLPLFGNGGAQVRLNYNLRAWLHQLVPSASVHTLANTFSDISALYTSENHLRLSIH